MGIYNKLSDQVIQDLEMLGFDDAANDVRQLRTLHDKAIAPKKRRAAKPRIPLKMLRLYVTEGGRTSTLEFDEKKAEAYLKRIYKTSVSNEGCNSHLDISIETI